MRRGYASERTRDPIIWPDGTEIPVLMQTERGASGRERDDQSYKRPHNAR